MNHNHSSKFKVHQTKNRQFEIRISASSLVTWSLKPHRQPNKLRQSGNLPNTPDQTDSRKRFSSNFFYCLMYLAGLTQTVRVWGPTESWQTMQWTQRKPAKATSYRWPAPNMVAAQRTVGYKMEVGRSTIRLLGWVRWRCKMATIQTVRWPPYQFGQTTHGPYQ